MRTARRRWVVIASVCVGLVAPGPAAAQVGFTAAAQAVARQVIADLDGMRWKQAAELFHPEAAERFKVSQVRMARQSEAADAGPPYRDPGLPAAVADWMARQDSIAWANSTPTLPLQFARVTTAAQLDSLPPVEVLARWLEARDERTQRRRVAAAFGRPEPGPVGAAVEPSAVSRSVMGGVWESDSTAQVLVRSRMANPTYADEGSLGVMTLRRTPRGWRVWTTQGGDRWMGNPGFRPGSELPVQTARDLDARRDSTLAWHDAAGNSVRAAVLGYPGGGRRPRAGLVEVRGADGALHTVEIPFGAMQDVVRYFSLWT